ncbi:MAG TPA: hypothetical protein VK348_12515, partial [Planctomycetota bacterium]|nr:hypothetical protein [Planctomycetota bacterium]
MDLRAHRRVWTRQRFRHFLRREFVQQMQQQHLPVRIGQHPHGGSHGFAQLQRRCCRRRIRSNFFRGRGRALRTQARLPPQVQRAVGQDAAQPRHDAARAVERRRILDRRQERRLHQVFGRMPVA